MTRWLALAISLAIVLAFLMGWLFPGRPEAPLGVTRGAGSRAELTLRPGDGSNVAIRFLRTLRRDPAPPPPPPPPVVIAPPPPPPPPDVSVVFKQALSGIERDPETGAFRALVRDPAAPSPQIAAMSVGARFGDGWRIREISADAVTLAKGREVRVVRLFG